MDYDGLRVFDDTYQVSLKLVQHLRKSKVFLSVFNMCESGSHIDHMTLDQLCTSQGDCT